MEQPDRRARREFTEEFKARTVELIESSGRSIAQFCRELDLTETAVRRWVLQARIDHGQASGLTSDERAELARLRRENKVLREEREILKKAATLSATLSRRSAGWLIFLLPGRSDSAVDCSLSCRPVDAPQKRPGVTS